MVNKKLRRFEEKHALLLVFVVLAVLVLGSLLVMDKAKFTGYAVIEGYNQSECVDAGYTWEEILNETCTDIPDCVECAEGCSEGEVCVSGCVESCVECEVDCQENCTDIPDCIECVDGCVESCAEVEICAEGCILAEDLCEAGCDSDCCVNEVIGGQCTGDVCDSNHLNLCDQTNCGTDGGGYWYNSECNAEAECVPDCGSKECGDDGCGGFCGTCNSGYSCDDGECEKDVTSSDVTGSAVDTDNEVWGSTCVSNWECGEWTDCIDNTQTREGCVDTNNCVTPTDLPTMSIPCISGEITSESPEILETCFDGMMNQDEKGIDCGGACEQKCSFFTIMGNAVNVPINSSKEFVQNNKAISFSILGVIVLAVSWIVCVKVFLKKKTFFFLNNLHFSKDFPFFKRKKKSDL